MTAEQIVRALAAAGPLVYDDHNGGGYQCALCEFDRDGSLEPSALDHDPDCPWRQAVEWVAAQDEAARL